MHKNATKCNKTQSKWCINKHGASKIIDTFETYHPSGLARPDIDLNRTPSTGCGTPAGLKKPRRMSTTDMPRAVNLFDEMTAPTEEVMAHPFCQLALPVA
jgi:hypothetical protein